MVSNLTKAQIKHIQAFAIKKYRDEQHCFVAEGLKNITDIIKNGLELVQVYVTEPLLLPKEIIIQVFEMEKISMLHNASNCIAIFKKPIVSQLNLINKISLIIDGVQDPGNLGTIIRTAHWFGISNIFCSMDSADAYAPKVVQATMGSIGAMPIIRCNLEELIVANKNIPSYAATLDGQYMYRMPKAKEAFIVVGKEGEGISKSIQDICTNKIKIEGIGSAESLNVAVATGIICHYFCINN